MEMIWDVFDDPSNRTACTIDGEQLSDGEHHICFEYDGIIKTTSVLVTDGKFSESTDNLVGIVVEASGYRGQFIEGFQKTENGLEVLIGS
tara:strand:- start:756 stop:1025 length:270 start_codon:yes stop_codon:yes gene_type:complete